MSPLQWTAYSQRPPSLQHLSIVKKNGHNDSQSWDQMDVTEQTLPCVGLWDQEVYFLFLDIWIHLEKQRIQMYRKLFVT